MVNCLPKQIKNKEKLTEWISKVMMMMMIDEYCLSF